MRALTEEVFHDPPIEMVEDPKVRTAGPTEVRLPLMTAVAPVKVRMPDQVMLEAKTVLIPGLTVRLY
ncbi:MAG: hypothetical protein ACREDF_00540, partial [Thermoplasmata archaeon]